MSFSYSSLYTILGILYDAIVEAQEEQGSRFTAINSQSPAFIIDKQLTSAWIMKGLRPSLSFQKLGEGAFTPDGNPLYPKAKTLPSPPKAQAPTFR